MAKGRGGSSRSLMDAAQDYFNGDYGDEDFAGGEILDEYDLSPRRSGPKAPKAAPFVIPEHEKPYIANPVIETGRSKGMIQMDQRTVRTCELSNAGWRPSMK